MSSLTIFFLSLGLLFILLGCVGLVRLPDIYNRLQAATKCVSLGTWSILLGLFFHYGITNTGIKALIGIPLIFLVSSVAAHSLARGSYLFGIKLWDKSVIDDYKNKVKVQK